MIGPGLVAILLYVQPFLCSTAMFAAVFLHVGTLDAKAHKVIKRQVWIWRRFVFWQRSTDLPNLERPGSSGLATTLSALTCSMVFSSSSAHEAVGLQMRMEALRV